MLEKCSCGSDRNAIVPTDYGTRVCSVCGREDFSAVLENENAYHHYCVPLYSPATYTRVKRFKKYLQRASMTQSASTIPQQTWDYLLECVPYKSPEAIVRRLKKARHSQKVLRFVAVPHTDALPGYQCAESERGRQTTGDLVFQKVGFRVLQRGAVCLVPVRARVHTGPGRAAGRAALH